MLITQENLDTYKEKLSKTKEIVYSWFFGPLIKTGDNLKIKNKEIEIIAENQKNKLSINVIQQQPNV